MLYSLIVSTGVVHVVVTNVFREDEEGMCPRGQFSVLITCTSSCTIFSTNYILFLVEFQCL